MARSSRDTGTRSAHRGPTPCGRPRSTSGGASSDRIISAGSPDRRSTTEGEGDDEDDRQRGASACGWRSSAHHAASRVAACGPVTRWQATCAVRRPTAERTGVSVRQRAIGARAALMEGATARARRPGSADRPPARCCRRCGGPARDRRDQRLRVGMRGRGEQIVGLAESRRCGRDTSPRRRG